MLMEMAPELPVGIVSSTGLVIAKVTRRSEAVVASILGEVDGEWDSESPDCERDEDCTGEDRRDDECTRSIDLLSGNLDCIEGNTVDARTTVTLCQSRNKY